MEVFGMLLMWKSQYSRFFLHRRKCHLFYIYFSIVEIELMLEEWLNLNSYNKEYSRVTLRRSWLNLSWREKREERREREGRGGRGGEGGERDKDVIKISFKREKKYYDWTIFNHTYDIWWLKHPLIQHFR